VISGFEQKRDKYMRPYGWEVSRYALPEQLLGWDAFEFDEEPEEAQARVEEKIRSVTGASAEDIRNLIKI